MNRRGSELQPSVLCELRLLAATQFDSRILLSVVLAGDARRTDKLRREELLPLGSRIRMRLTMEYARSEDLTTGAPPVLLRTAAVKDGPSSGHRFSGAKRP